LLLVLEVALELQRAPPLPQQGLGRRCLVRQEWRRKLVMRPHELLQCVEERALRVGHLTIVRELGAAELGVPQPCIDELEHVALPGGCCRHACAG
jgi:hypothetical protein